MSSDGPSAVASDRSSRQDEHGSAHTNRRKITRTKNGCLTCRKRRKLCDLDRPDCGACLRLGLECVWPEAPRPNSTKRARASVATDDELGSTQSRPDSYTSPSNEPESRLVSQTRNGTRLDSFAFYRPPEMLAPHANSMSDLMGIMSGSSDPTGLVLRDDTFAQQTTSNGTLPASTVDSSNGLAPFAFDELGTARADDPLSSLLDGVMFDEATLQQWAAECLAVPATQTIDPFQSLSDLLRQPASAAPVPDPHTALLDPTAEGDLIPRVPPHPEPQTVSPHHAHLLKHYQASLSSLVSCTGDSESAPSAFAAFTKLAEASSSSEAGQGLQLSILAWAGRHMANQGEIKFETISDKLGEKGTRIITERLESWKTGHAAAMTETERMTLLAGALMVVSFKICRGDVWGFDTLTSYLKLLSDSLYQVNTPGAPPDSMPFHFFENLVYHDLTCSDTYAKGPIVPYSVLTTYSNPSSDYLNTLTGACFPVFCRFNRIATLAAQRRQKSQTKTARRKSDEEVRWTTPWSDEDLYDLVTSAREIEDELKEDKKQMEVMVRNKPSLSSHRFLHEAYRITGLLALHSFVLCEPPSSFAVRLLVRQSLSLLEEMYEKNLPGFCSVHLVLFVTALCCCKNGSGAETDVDNDCQRIERLYEHMRNDYAFGNIARSPKIYREVWERNQQGRIYVDWLDVIDDFGWELFLV